jgi:hypothetical protein
LLARCSYFLPARHDTHHLSKPHKIACSRRRPAPLVVKGKVLVGNSGGEFGVRGWLTALNAADGKIAWRAYHTGPDADVLIGPNFHPYYPQDQGKDLGVSSWPSDAWRIGGATDVGLDLI